MWLSRLASQSDVPKTSISEPSLMPFRFVEGRGGATEQHIRGGLEMHRDFCKMLCVLFHPAPTKQNDICNMLGGRFRNGKMSHSISNLFPIHTLSGCAANL